MSCPHTSKQNERVERKHRHVAEMGLILMAQAKLPLKFWWAAFSTATRLMNGLSSYVLNDKSPMEVLLNRQLNITSLRTFDCACFPCLRSYQTNKFNFHSEKCVYLGPSLNHKGHRCLSFTVWLYISRDVQFNEEEFSFAQQFLLHPWTIHHPQLF